MSDLQKSIADALEALAAQHGIREPVTDALEALRPSSLPVVRRTTVIDTTARVTREDAERRRASASKEERAAEGSYAEVELGAVTVTVFVLTVERTGFGARATCKRLDTRQSLRVRLDELLNLRVEE